MKIDAIILSVTLLALAAFFGLALFDTEGKCGSWSLLCECEIFSSGEKFTIEPKMLNIADDKVFIFDTNGKRRAWPIINSNSSAYDAQCREVDQ